MSKNAKAVRKTETAEKKINTTKKTLEKTTIPTLRSKPKVADPTRKGPRRTIFIDVENTSSEGALLAALEKLEVDSSEFATELVAVGNWRVIGQHVARMLAQKGCRLLHTAPATGVKDWSDLSIAVAAGVWLGRAEPGDQMEIVSADRAFDAVADAAAALGVKFRRLTYGGSTSSVAERFAPAETGVGRRSRRGGRGRRRPAAAPLWPTGEPPAPPAPQASNGADADVQGATPDQIVAAVARLSSRDRGRGVNLDLLINALKEEGFGRPPGSPRLVTRLRKMKDVEVSPTGMVRLVSRPAPGTFAEATSTEPLLAPAGFAPSRRRSRRRGGRGRRGSSAAAGAGTSSGEAPAV